MVKLNCCDSVRVRHRAPVCYRLPLLVGVWIHRQLRVSWLLFAAGAITFGLSQAVHLPLNYGIFALIDEPDAMPVWATALILGLTAGLCEESARYAAYRWV